MSESLPPDYPYSVEGVDASIKAQDFDERVDVIPVSNPNAFSQAQRITLAQTKMQLAAQAPEMHNMYEVFYDMYESLGVRDIDRILKNVPQEEPAPLDPAQENINAMDMAKLTAFEGQDHQSHIMAHLVFGASPMVVNNPVMAVAIQKHIMEHVQIQSREQAVQMAQQQGIQANPNQLEALTAQMIAQGLQQARQLSQQISGAGQPDPLVELKKQEIQIKAQSEQSDAQIDQQKVALDQRGQDIRREQFDKRLQSQEKQTQQRIQAGKERELLKLQRR